MKKNNQKGFWIILFLLFGLFGGMYLLQRQQEVRRKAAYGSVGLMLLPSEKEIEVGENIDLCLQIVPGEFLVNLVKIRLGYNPMLVELNDVKFRNNFTGSFKESEGEVEIIALTTMSRKDLEDLTSKQSFEIVRLSFKAVNQGQAEISRVGDYAITGSRGIGGPEDRSLELKSFSSSTVIVSEEEQEPAPPEPPEGWPKLTFKIFFGGTRYTVGGQQRIVSNIGKQEVDVVVKGNGINSKYNNVPVEFDDQAIGTGSLTLVGVEPGDNYAVLIKGPVHLARRFCFDGQTDHCWLGEEDISLVSGENVYDWTGLELEPGDIDGNGVINSLDFSLLKQALGAEGEVKEDINFNRVVDVQDVAFFLRTLSEKYGDEI